MHNLWKNVEPRRIKIDGTNWEMTAGTGDTLTSSAIDTQGYDAIAIMEAFGVITSTAVTTFKLQHSTDDAATDAYADIAGTSQSIADTDDNKILLSEIYRPAKRYLKVITTRATANAVIDGLFVFLHKARNVPVSYGTTVQGTPETFNSPASGTA